MQRSSGAPSGAAGGPSARRPELPRTLLDTRMPPAPAAGGRVIAVAPSEPARSVTNDRNITLLLLSALLLAVTAGLCAWFITRRRNARHLT
jgi:hypothetical protein